MRAQQPQRAHRIRILPLQSRLAPLGRQRLGQHEHAVAEVQQAAHARDPERQPGIVVSEPAANGRAKNKAGSKSRAEHAKCLGALFGSGDVADVGGRSRNAGRGYPRQYAPQKQPADRRRDGHYEVIERQAEIRKQYHWPATEAV